MKVGGGFGECFKGENKQMETEEILNREIVVQV